MNRVSDDSKRVFSQLGLNDFSNLAIVATEINGIDCDAIASITEDQAQYNIMPIAVIVNEALFQQLKNPESDLK